MVVTPKSNFGDITERHEAAGCEYLHQLRSSTSRAINEDGKVGGISKR
jgi:hypothetical protein